MRKFSMWRTSFWDSAIWSTLRHLPAEHIRVYLHLVHGPTGDITGIYRISIGAIADDTDIDADHARAIIGDLADTGWCDYEHPVIWIIGHGNVVDQLGKEDWTSNPKWRTAAIRQLDALPNLAIVDRFRRRWGLPSTLPDLEGDIDKDAGYAKGIDRLSVDKSISSVSTRETDWGSVRLEGAA
jgi:hypothetical protein